ncbi:MAG: hypothetical protein ACOZF0_07245 [Thermodesulfobacteriota bacterium]
MFYLVSYDIPDDKRRLKIAKTIKDFGDRVREMSAGCRNMYPIDFKIKYAISDNRGRQSLREERMHA